MRIISGIARGTKLYTLEGLDTRPTLDRVKEPLFSIINFNLQDKIILDLFAGSGALGLEALSRGAQKAFFCEKNKDAINIIKKNVEKTKFADKSYILEGDFSKGLEKLANKVNIDIVFIDPPYKTDLIVKSLEKLIDLKLLNQNAIIVAETDEPIRIKEDIKKLNCINIFDERKYGRVSLLFLSNIN